MRERASRGRTLPTPRRVTRALRMFNASIRLGSSTLGSGGDDRDNLSQLQLSLARNVKFEVRFLSGLRI